MIRTMTRGTVLGLAALAAVPAFAQSTAGNPSSTSNDSMLTEIVVTAQRREEKAVDVPITITSMSGDQLEAAGVDQIGDVATVTPALRFDRESAFVQPSIRGVGTSLVTSGGGANVGIYVDGFYSPNPLAAEFDLLNVQSVQVLKGPQGTLFGRNTTGGAILVSTAEPSKDASATLQATYGRFNTQRYQAYGTTALTDNLALDIEGQLSKGDGYWKDLVSGSDKVGEYENSTIRIGAKLDLSDDNYLLLRYTHWNYDDPMPVMVQPFVVDGVPFATGTFILGNTVTTAHNKVALTFEPKSKINSDIVQLTGNFDLGFGTLKSYSQYRGEDHVERIDGDATAAPLFAIEIPIEDQVITQEFLLSSNSGTALQWTTGLFYMSYKDYFHNVGVSDGLTPYTPIAKSFTKTESLAGFFDGTYELTPQFFVTAGVRYSRDKVKDAFFNNPGPAGFTQFDLPTLSKSRVTPRLVLRYKPTDESSLYASYTKGYKAPIYNVGGNTDVPVDAESIDAYEVGYKYANSTLTFDVSSYYYDYKDLQVATYNGTQSLINNAANSTIYGAEAAVRYQVMQGLSLNVGAAYTHAQFDEYQESPFFTPGFLTIATAPADDNQMPRSPKFTGTLGAQYTTPVAGGSLGLSGNWYHTSKFFFDSSNQFEQGAYDTLNLRAEWTDPSDRYTVALIGDNVTGKRYRTMANGVAQLAIRSVWSYPAMYSAQVRVKF